MTTMKGRKRTMKKADNKPAQDQVVAERILASLNRVHMRTKKY